MTNAPRKRGVFVWLWDQHTIRTLPAIGKAVVWLFVACLVIAASLYAGNASSGGIGVLVLVASLIASLLYQVVDLLLRIAKRIEDQ